MKIDSVLKHVVELGEFKIPVVEFRFKRGTDSMVAIAQFNPERIMVAEGSEHNRLDMIDEEGHVYTTLDYNHEWLEAATDSQVIVTVMKVPIRVAGTGARIIVTTFPFGEIISDSGTFSTDRLDVPKVMAKINEMEMGAEEVIKKIHEVLQPN